MSKMQKTSADNRKCMYPNCTQTLSIYNHEAYCHVHRVETPPGHHLHNLDQVHQERKTKIPSY